MRAMHAREIKEMSGGGNPSFNLISGLYRRLILLKFVEFQTSTILNDKRFLNETVEVNFIRRFVF
jgi:hypothetical protein